MRLRVGPSGVPGANARRALGPVHHVGAMASMRMARPVSHDATDTGRIMTTPGWSEVRPHHGRRWRFLIFQIGEIFVFVTMNLQGSQKLSVIIPRGKAEVRTAESAEDAREITVVLL